jgi:hypothetical protein
MRTLPEVRELVAKVIGSTGKDVQYTPLNENAWEIKVGTAAGYLFLSEDEKNPAETSIFVSFSIMGVPLTEESSFYRRLLEINNTLSGRSSFSVDTKDIVWLNAGRKIVDLDANELLDLILHTSRAADYYDDVLLDQFGRQYALPKEE